MSARDPGPHEPSPHEPGPRDPDPQRVGDEPPRLPQTTADPYRPHLRDRQPWASRGRILLWAFVPVVAVVGLVVWAHYN